ncbi:MAG: FAD-dependent oxidoreductase [Thermoguttaceae bacterium]|nr:FAD-dependent oxidoreductase [Thermoguttaceae bacterium]MDW8077563.1 FAD-dependent oxidoreductase [Thermoguttaceae bacterium]
MKRLSSFFLGVAVIFGFGQLVLAAAIRQSSRQIPVAYNVDVLVVGGTTGAVSAAVAAANAGAKVFLAAPFPYLGEDVTATLKLWLEEGEEPTHPLAEQIYNDPQVRLVTGTPLPFTYQADLPSAKPHPDTDPPRLLRDGRWGNAVNESVQYNGNVRILVDLSRPQEVDRVNVVYYHRGGGENPFKVARIILRAGNSPENLKAVGEYDGAEVLQQNPGGDAPVLAEIPCKQACRYLEIQVEKTPDSPRILLGEIEVLAPSRTQPASSARPMPRPLHVKRVLDQALLNAGVQYLYNCYVTDCIRDSDGRVVGVVMANRAGRQAVLAKTIVDATDRAVVARLAGGEFRSFPAAEHTFEFVVIGGEPKTAPQLRSRIIEPPFSVMNLTARAASGGPYPIIHYEVTLPVENLTWPTWAQVEQTIRTLTYDPRQQFTSDWLFFISPDAVIGEKTLEREDVAPAALPVDALRPKGLSNLFVLGPCADVPRKLARQLTRPVVATILGERIGQEAAQLASRLPAPSNPLVCSRPLEGQALADVDVSEILVGVRPIQELPRIAQPESALPILGEYDVVVVGGGTGGAPAGIAAARQGAKTLVVEMLHGLGGVGTEGAISSYYWGNRVGFTASIPTGNRWQIEEKKEWFRRALLDAGADIWMGVIGCGALTQGNIVRGVVVATPFGRAAVLAKVVIDATGNADIAAAAGAQCYYTDASEFGMQGTGLPFRNLGASYTNTDFTIADETDIVDIWHLFVYAKDLYPGAFDQGRLVDTRERRRIVGEFTMTLADQLLGRTYPDTIEIAYSDFDTHGYTVDPLLELEHPERRGFYIRVPYRCLIPKGLKNILVGSLATSMHRDAVPMTRMQADIQNQGYAAGVAAAMAAKQKVDVRGINIRALQEHLIEVGNLPKTVLEETDNFPLPAAKIAEAVAKLPAEEPGAAAVVLTHPEQSLPLLRKAYLEAQDPKAKLVYAQALAILGDNTGLETILEAIREYQDWDQGWNYRGMGQYGQALSTLDRLIIAAGRTRDRRAVPVILEKLEKLGPESEFSHYRAVGLALELIGDPSAAPLLAALLSRPYMTGYVHKTVEDARQHALKDPAGTSGVLSRRESLRELLIARALFRCGDYGNLGRQVLENYTQDLRGHLARHAKAVLEYGPRPVRPEDLK